MLSPPSVRLAATAFAASLVSNNPLNFVASAAPYVRSNNNAARTLPLAFSTSSSAQSDKVWQPNQLLTLGGDNCNHLQNSYCALRHGQSLANVAKLISSDPKVSTIEHGLSDFGHQQAKDAGREFAQSLLPLIQNAEQKEYQGVAIFSSDFKRAKETAQHMADACLNASIPLYKDGVIMETRLRERNFGELNGGPDTRYQDVWDVDVQDPTHTEFGCESVYSVVERTTGLVLDIDRKLSAASSEGGGRYKCVLVAHGDVLQILQTGFKKMDGALHRTLPHLETATVRDLVLSDSPLCGYHALN